MDDRLVLIAKKWEALRDKGFRWGKHEEVRHAPDPYDPFPVRIKAEPLSSSCWIKHESWKCRLVVKQFIKPEMKPIDVQEMWFETFDRIIELKDVDAFQAAKFMLESYGIWKKNDGGSS
jgi:hypothetical protein